jgi:integration host factor subunit beta
MIRSELVLRVATLNPGLTQADAEAAVAAMLSRIADALAAGDRVEIRDFASFATRPRRARDAFNPKTGDRVRVGERTAVVFKPGKRMRTLLIEKDREDASARRGWTTRVAAE